MRRGPSGARFAKPRRKTMTLPLPTKSENALIDWFAQTKPTPSWAQTCVKAAAIGIKRDPVALRLWLGQLLQQAMRHVR
jgi:hypothetical protein